MKDIYKMKDQELWSEYVTSLNRMTEYANQENSTPLEEGTTPLPTTDSAYELEEYIKKMREEILRRGIMEARQVLGSNGSAK